MEYSKKKNVGGSGESQTWSPSKRKIRVSSNPNKLYREEKHSSRENDIKMEQSIVVKMSVAALNKRLKDRNRERAGEAS